MIKTILVPTDGSGHANKTIELAADIANKYGARMVILHVLLRHASASDIRVLCKEIGAPKAMVEQIDENEAAMLSAVSVPYGPVLIPAPMEVVKELGDLVAEKARGAVEAKGAKDVTVQVVDASPAECIIAAAEHEKADMIVMGSRGLSNIGGLLMGSVSHKVSHLAPCTCVTVK